MNKVDIAGLGIWSETFQNIDDFRAGLRGGTWASESRLQPDRIPARERRRAPQLVKMAIEVMDQACASADISPSNTAVVFSSSMGDIQITDYMCRALTQTPKLISPTRFHNSVHNAAPGYWSITTGAFAPATAISAYEYTAPMAFLEAAIQVVEEDMPVVVVTQEVAAIEPLLDICPSRRPFSAAFLMQPSGGASAPIASIDFAVQQERVEWPVLDPVLADAFTGNFGATLLPLLCAIANGAANASLRFPISESSSLVIDYASKRASND